MAIWPLCRHCLLASLEALAQGRTTFSHSSAGNLRESHASGICTDTFSPSGSRNVRKQPGSPQQAQLLTTAQESLEDRRGVLRARHLWRAAGMKSAWLLGAQILQAWSFQIF